MKPSAKARKRHSVSQALYTANRQLAMERDHHECRAWGWAAIDGLPTMCAGHLVCHHIEPGGMGRPRNHSLTNLMALCERHHEMVHSHPAEARRDGFLK